MKIHLSFANLEPDESPVVVITDSAGVNHTLALPDQGNCFAELNAFHPITVQLQGIEPEKEPEKQAEKEPEEEKSFLTRLFK